MVHPTAKLYLTNVELRVIVCVCVCVLVLLILVGNVLLGLQLVSYFRAIYTVHKPIPDQVCVCLCLHILCVCVCIAHFNDNYTHTHMQNVLSFT